MFKSFVVKLFLSITNITILKNFLKCARSNLENSRESFLGKLWLYSPFKVNF